MIRNNKIMNLLADVDDLEQALVNGNVASIILYASAVVQGTKEVADLFDWEFQIHASDL